MTSRDLALGYVVVDTVPVSLYLSLSLCVSLSVSLPLSVYLTWGK